MIIGNKIYLRAIEPDTDLQKCYYWVNDRMLTKFLALHMPYSKGFEKEWLEKAAKHQHERAYHLAIVVKANDQYIGNVGLMEINSLNRNAELGIMIGDRTYWNQGYGTEAVKLMCRYGFKNLNLHRIFLKVFSHNERAIRCYEKAGFKHEGTLRDSNFINGEYRDSLIYGILEKEFKE